MLGWPFPLAALRGGGGSGGGNGQPLAALSRLPGPRQQGKDGAEADPEGQEPSGPQAPRESEASFAGRWVTAVQRPLAEAPLREAEPPLAQP